MNRNAAGSIPDGTIGIFNLLNPSSSSMVMRSTWPLTGVFPGDKAKLVRRADSLPTSRADKMEILGTSTCWTPMGPFRPVLG
jgi:hypothetical protein